MHDWSGGIAAGTPLLTPGGPLPAAELVEGELIVTGSGAVVPLLWLGRERIAAVHHPRPDHIRPVRIRQGAFGAGLPHHDVVLAPGHGVYVDGLLVPAGLLVNGATIVSEAPAPLFTWFHVALAAHDTLVAGGIAVESYCALPPAARTANGAAAPAPPPPLAPRATEGAALERLRSRLLEHAGAFGFTLDHEPALRLRAGSATLLPERQPDGAWRFTLPACDGPLRLLSRSCIGQWVWPSSRDTRRLGVAVRAITLTSGGVATELPLRDQTSQGWHAVEGDATGSWRWTDGEAVLTCPPTREADTLSLALAFTGAYWNNAAPGAQDGSGVVFLSGEPHTPGHVYRVLRPLAAAHSLGVRASWMTVEECVPRLAEIAAATTLVIWRAPLSDVLDRAIAAARAAGAHVLFDLDDLMVEPALARADVIDAIRVNSYRPDEIRTLYQGLRATARAADACLATTEELALHLRGARCGPVG